MRLLIAINAHSRHGREPIGEALEVFRSAGCSTQVETVPKSKHIPKLLEKHTASTDALVLGGGDGTVHQALPILLRTGLPFGVLPLGTANDFAKNLDIPIQLRDAATTIVRGHIRRIDVAEVDGHPFLNVASIGLSSKLKRELSDGDKQRRGRLAYAVAGLRSLVRTQRFQAGITAGGGTNIVHAVQISVANGRYHGGYATADSAARIDDGQLHLVSLEPSGILQLVASLPAFILGRHQASGSIQHLSGQQILVRTQSPLKIVADGKNVGTTPARFSIHPQALKVFAPAHESPS